MSEINSRLKRKRKLVEDIVAANNVRVPEDFTIPQVTEEQIQQMRAKAANAANAAAAIGWRGRLAPTANPQQNRTPRNRNRRRSSLIQDGKWKMENSFGSFPLSTFSFRYAA